MTTDDLYVIKKAQVLGAVFKRDGKTRWTWEGCDYSYKTRLDATYEYLDATNPALQIPTTSQT